MKFMHKNASHSSIPTVHLGSSFNHNIRTAASAVFCIFLLSNAAMLLQVLEFIPTRIEKGAALTVFTTV